MSRAPLILGALAGIGIMITSRSTSRKADGVLSKPAANFRPGRQDGPPIWVVIHTAESHERPDSAEALETWATAKSTPVSWHYAVDADSTTQSVREQDTAYTAGPGNSLGVHIELAGIAAQTEKEWADPYSTAVLERAARLVRKICERWNIPMARIGRDEILALKSGICGHSDITDASQYAAKHAIRTIPWYRDGKQRTTDHRDPGTNFPWALFMELVNQ